MKAKLRVVSGRATKQEIVLALPAIVGRAKESGLCVRHPTVSRKHCELREEQGLLVVEDLGSSNGIIVGDRLVPRATLQPGDRLTIGPLTFEAHYKVNGVAKSAPAAPAAAAATVGVPPLADTEVESDFDFLSDDAPEAEPIEVAAAPAAEDDDLLADLMVDEPVADSFAVDDIAVAVEPVGAAAESAEFDLGDSFDLQPMEDELLGAPSAPPAGGPAALDEASEEFPLPDDIPLALDDIALEDIALEDIALDDMKLDDAPQPAAEADDFALSDDLALGEIALDEIPLADAAEPSADAGASGLRLHETLEFDLEEEPAQAAKAEAKPAKAAQAAPPAAKPAVAPASDGDTLDGLDDWLGLSDD